MSTDVATGLMTPSLMFIDLKKLSAIAEACSPLICLALILCHAGTNKANKTRIFINTLIFNTLIGGGVAA